MLQREKGKAVLQLASQQPDGSGLFKAVKQTTQRLLVWRNKPQQKDACIATLAHKAKVKALAVSAKRIVGGSGTSLFVYNAETDELLEELEGAAEVMSVAICEKGSLIVAGYEDGTIKVWDGAPPPTLFPLFFFAEPSLITPRSCDAGAEEREAERPRPRDLVCRLQP